jgi:hypothetical protein
MKKYLVPAAALLALLACPPLSAQDPASKTLGLGFAFGEPSGIAAKWWLGERLALNGRVSWSAVDQDTGELFLATDLLVHTFGIFEAEAGQEWRLPLYVGIGGQLTRPDDETGTVFGLRLPVGITFMPLRIPVDVFAEIGPVMQFGDARTFTFTAGVGFLLFFF